MFGKQCISTTSSDGIALTEGATAVALGGCQLPAPNVLKKTFTAFHTVINLFTHHFFEVAIPSHCHFFALDVDFECMCLQDGSILCCGHRNREGQLLVRTTACHRSQGYCRNQDFEISSVNQPIATSQDTSIVVMRLSAS